MHFLILEKDAVATLKAESRGADVEESEVTPIAFNRIKLEGKHDDALMDRQVEISGYGETMTNESGRFFTTVVYGGVDTSRSEFIKIVGSGAGAACAGDSGGPLMAQNERNRPIILGVLHGGAADCMGVDFMQRLDVIQEWIDRGIEASWALKPVGSQCSDRDFGPYDDDSFHGRCVGHIAEYCDEEFKLQRLDCAAMNSVCVFKDESEGFYCDRPERCAFGGSCLNPVEGFVPVGPIGMKYKGACTQLSSPDTIFFGLGLFCLAIVTRRRRHTRH